MKIIAFINEHSTVAHIVQHIRMPAQRPDPLAHSPPLHDELLCASGEHSRQRSGGVYPRARPRARWQPLTTVTPFNWPRKARIWARYAAVFATVDCVPLSPPCARGHRSPKGTINTLAPSS